MFDEMKRSMGRMPESQLVTSVLLPMMSALLAMHAAGFIHRDIKPENTLFAANRVLKLAGALLLVLPRLRQQRRLRSRQMLLLCGGGDQHLGERGGLAPC